MSTQQTYNLRIIKLVCHISEENDADEVFLKQNNEKVWPQNKRYVSLREGSVPVGIELPNVVSGEVVDIELWDHDPLNPNDHLGSFNLLVNEKGGPFKTDLKKKDSEFASYTLEWETI